MAGKSRGLRESEWLVMRRCLAIVLRLQRGPASKAALLQAVYDCVGEDAYGSSEGDALSKRFDGDKRRLRQHLGIQVRYDAGARGYLLIEHEMPLLELGDSHLQTLAFLADTFATDTPHGRQVQELVDTLISWHSADRRLRFNRLRGLLPDVDLRLRDSEPIAADVWRAVTEAHNARRQLRFDYRSSRHDDELKRVAPNHPESQRRLKSRDPWL